MVEKIIGQNPKHDYRVNDLGFEYYMIIEKCNIGDKTLAEFELGLIKKFTQAIERIRSDGRRRLLFYPDHLGDLETTHFSGYPGTVDFREDLVKCNKGDKYNLPFITAVTPMNLETKITELTFSPGTQVIHYTSLTHCNYKQKTDPKTNESSLEREDTDFFKNILTQRRNGYIVFISEDAVFRFLL